MQKNQFHSFISKDIERGRFGVENVSKTLKCLFEFFFNKGKFLGDASLVQMTMVLMTLTRIKLNITCKNNTCMNDTCTNDAGTNDLHK
jgi:hypothetical protein